MAEASIATSQQLRQSVLISTSNVTTAWAHAFIACAARPSGETAPLVVDLHGFQNGPDEDLAVRAQADQWLSETNRYSIGTTASLIFPEESWLYHRTEGAKTFFQYYLEAYFPRLRAASPLNARGTYFQRMLCYGPGNINQLERLFDDYHAGLRRRSAFQLVIFDPTRDHSRSPRLGFPCLDYLAFSPRDGTLTMTAMYAMQYLHDRAYGNYLGLCALGRFIASQLGLTFTRLTCTAAVAQIGSLSRGQAKRMADHLAAVVATPAP